MKCFHKYCLNSHLNLFMESKMFFVVNKFDTTLFKWIFWLAWLLLIPALLINLGLPTFIDDEGIRSLVAIEMELSNNWITPTLLGEYYYNKPPFFNWILALFFSVFNSNDEFIARLPTVIAVFGYGLTIYLFFSRHYGVKWGFIHAFVTITCGRILFWDSMLGLIDITFSWVIFSLFISIFTFYEKKQFLNLFLLTYVLAAIGFLLKGLPAIVFQGFSILAIFIYHKDWKKLFSLNHFLGISVFLLVVGSYYIAYHQYNDLFVVFNTLFTESSKRTAIRFGLLETIRHIFEFPFEMVYHFLPWSIFSLYFFDKQSIRIVKNQPLPAFLSLMFLVNIVVYWTSPEVYPRYLLMLAPLYYGVLLILHDNHQARQTLHYKITYWLLFTVMGLISLGSLAPFFLERVEALDLVGVIPKTIFLFTALSLLTIGYWKFKRLALPLLVLFLIVLRIGFDWFVLPDRNANDYGDLVRKSSIKVGKAFKEEQLFVYKESEMHPTNAYYITRERGKIVHRDKEGTKQSAYYIFDPEVYSKDAFNLIDSIFVRHGKPTYYVGQIISK